MLIAVMVDRIVDVDSNSSKKCGEACPFMRGFQDENTLEFGKMCTLGEKLIPLYKSGTFYERTEECLTSEWNKNAVDDYMERRWYD